METQPAQQTQNLEFMIQNIFVKDLSFESPNVPAIFTKPWKGDANVAINTSSQPLDDTHYEVVLSVTVTAKSNDETAYVAEVKQAGVFTITHASKEQLGPLLGSYCPNILFPYARENIGSLINRGGFPELQLAPVNFDALYAQSIQQAAQQNQTKH